MPLMSDTTSTTAGLPEATAWSRAPWISPGWCTRMQGEARQRFIHELFQRQGLTLSAEELHHVCQQTAHYSARDFDNLVREVKAQGKPVLEVLHIWQASTAIVQQRRLQTLIAALHCSYPQLLPEWLRNMSAEAIQQEVEGLQWGMHR